MMEPKELAVQIAKHLDEKKAMDVTVIEISGKASFADHLVLATGGSERQMSSLVEHVEDLPDHVFGLGRVGLTAGASTPEPDVEKLSAAFADAGFEITDLKRT